MALTVDVDYEETSIKYYEKVIDKMESRYTISESTQKWISVTEACDDSIFVLVNKLLDSRQTKLHDK